MILNHQYLWNSNSLLFDIQKQASGFHIAYTQSKGAVNWIETLRLRSLSLTPLSARYQIGKGIHSGIRFTSDLKWMVTIFNSPSQPPDLWMFDVESGESIQLTHSMPEELSSEEFVMLEEIVYAGMDGVKSRLYYFVQSKRPRPRL